MYLLIFVSRSSSSVFFSKSHILTKNGSFNSVTTCLCGKNMACGKIYKCVNIKRERFQLPFLPFGTPWLNWGCWIAVGMQLLEKRKPSQFLGFVSDREPISFCFFQFFPMQAQFFKFQLCFASSLLRRAGAALSRWWFGSSLQITVSGGGGRRDVVRQA